MSENNDKDDSILFAPEDEKKSSPVDPSKQWKVLIVDDEEGVHEVTLLAMTDFQFENRGLNFLHAYNASEARTVIKDNPDIALAIVDVVMETEHAGLDLVHYIRNELKNKLIRIILRTGQPGQAPERSVIRNYDINDYKEKSELSSQKLYSAIYTSLRSYRDLNALTENRRGLEQVITASGEIFKMTGLNGFIQGVLKQLVALLYLDNDSMYVNCDSMALENDEDIIIVAGTGKFSAYVGSRANDTLSAEVMALIEEALEKKAMVLRDGVYVGYFQPRSGREDVIYITSSRNLNDDDSNMIQLFLHNASIAYENAILREEIEGTQRDMVYMLGEAIETRSKETGQHVRRVAEYCFLIACGLGLTNRDAEILRIAAPLHDFGKIGIPDSILHKPGKLNDEEWVEMKTHAELGQEMLGRSDREILKAASALAGHHHEKWDGSGYPNGISGEEIHLFGRIGAVADVFDALGSKRCYKGAWKTEQIITFLEEQRGSHFEPKIVDWVLNNMDKMLEVRQEFPDHDD